LANRLFFEHLIRHTGNFRTCRWMGRPIWQNILDLWVIQETLWEVKPELLIECGTHRGGSASFYAQLMDLMGRGRVVTIDVQEMHDLSHPRVEFVLGSSTADDVVSRIRETVSRVEGPVMVILDSDHSASHVRQELELYAPLVTPGSYIIVQDGIIDVLRRFRSDRPGPLVALGGFLAAHPEFEAERDRSNRFLISHHPSGWLRRKL
jgi:cephalosporin hydroxylase